MSILGYGVCVRGVIRRRLDLTLTGLGDSEFDDGVVGEGCVPALESAIALLSDAIPLIEQPQDPVRPQPRTCVIWQPQRGVIRYAVTLSGLPGPQLAWCWSVLGRTT
jgi:hypothetical protein